MTTNTDNKKSKKLLIKIFFIVTTILLCFYLIIVSTVSHEMYYETNALTSTGTTRLNTGEGLKEGENHLRLTGITNKSVSGSSASAPGEASVDITQTGSPDLYISGHIKANKGTEDNSLIGGFDAKTSDSGYFLQTTDGIAFASYPRATLDFDLIMNSRIKLSDTLENAIKDPMLVVKIQAKVTAKSRVGDGVDNCYIALNWLTDGTGSAIYDDNSKNIGTTNTSSELQFTSDFVEIESISTNSILLFQLGEFSQTSNEKITQMGGIGNIFEQSQYYNSAIAGEITDINIVVTIEKNDAMTFADRGYDFSDVTITGENRDSRCNNGIVKAGDIITISTNLRYDNQDIIMSYENDEFYVKLEDTEDIFINQFRHHYIQAYDSDGDGSISGPEKSELMKISTIEWDYNESYMTRIIDNDDFDITGQTAKFLIGDIPAGAITNLSLRPYLRSYINGTFAGLGTTATQYNTLFGDSTPPYEPEIDLTEPFLDDYIYAGKWYSQDFDDGTSGNDRGVYKTLSLNSACFATSGGAKQKIYYTTDGSDPTDSSTRRLLLDNIIAYDDSTITTIFFPLPGNSTQNIFTLRLISFDYAGNKSSVIRYDNIKIDCTDYFLNVYFVQGTSLSSTYANTSATSALGKVELGKKSGVNKDYDKVARRSYKRNELAYIRLTMKKDSDYRLFQYYNSGNRSIVCNDINYGDFPNGDLGDFIYKNSTEVYLWVPNPDEEVAIEITDDMVRDLNNLNFYFFFKKEIPITIGSTSAVYDGTEKGIEQPTTIYSNIEIVTYYKENIDDEFQSTAKFIEAGTYYYKSEIIDGTFFGEVEGEFIIEKADPYITGIEIQDITYENSMAVAIIKCECTNENDPNTIYYTNCSSDGKVSGIFKITSPNPETIGYINPSQGYKNVTVTFTPSPDYQSNYNEVSFPVVMYVNYSNNLNIDFDETTFNYVFEKDVERAITINTTPNQNEYMIIEYKREGESDSSYTTQEPVDAGIYEVRARTDLEICNYDNMKSTENTNLKLVIEQVEISVEAVEAVCYYQYDAGPIAEAYYVVGRYKEYIPISQWKY